MSTEMSMLLVALVCLFVSYKLSGMILKVFFGIINKVLSFFD